MGERGSKPKNDVTCSKKYYLKNRILIIMCLAITYLVINTSQLDTDHIVTTSEETFNVL